MAMQICVLSDHRLDSVAEWQTAIDAEGFPLQLSDADPTRNLAARLADEETSIEYDVHDFSDLKDAYRHVNFERGWKYAITFTWSTDFAEALAAWMGATAYARATNGVIFDEQEVKLFTPDESFKIARDIEQRRPATEAMLRNYIEQLSAKSPEAQVALRSFMEKRSSKSIQK
jgi:hypothetical protein